ncbi:MAG TPA: efflux RND transporter periplasmic adaptor subunit [Rhodopila sp.]|nr:efflux RND transporter periplasmic adaptor subunit [Rhodopila sp.]
MSDTMVEAAPAAHPEPPHREPAEDGLEPVRVRKGRLIVVGLGALAAAAVVAAYGIMDRSHSDAKLAELTAEEAIPTVAVIHPMRGVTGQTIELPGRIDAYFQAPIFARVSGYLQMWYKDIGAQVHKGDLLALIETPDLDQELVKAKADLAVAQANYKLAQVTAARWQKLAKADAVSVQEVDVKTSDAAAQKAAVNAAEANVSRLEALESFKRIVAPFDGVVTARRTDVGALINAGSGSGPELFAVADVHEMRVYVRVPQRQSGGIHPGMEATLTLPQYPGRTFPATVDTTSGAIDPLSNTLLVELIAKNPDGLLTPGTFAQVSFKLPADPNVVRIPTSALLFRKGGLKVATLGPDGKVTIKPITAGRDLGTELEVLAGLEPTERVINSPPDSLINGQTVRVAGQKTADAGAKPVDMAHK